MLMKLVSSCITVPHLDVVKYSAPYTAWIFFFVIHRLLSAFEGLRFRSLLVLFYSCSLKRIFGGMQNLEGIKMSEI